MLLGAIRCDQSGCTQALLKAVPSSHEVGAATVFWSPGDVVTSPNIQVESHLPGPSGGGPLTAGLLCPLSSAQEATLRD